MGYCLSREAPGAFWNTPQGWALDTGRVPATRQEKVRILRLLSTCGNRTLRTSGRGCLKRVAAGTCRLSGRGIRDSRVVIVVHRCYHPCKKGVSAYNAVFGSHGALGSSGAEFLMIVSGTYIGFATTRTAHSHPAEERGNYDLRHSGGRRRINRHGVPSLQ